MSDTKTTMAPPANVSLPPGSPKLAKDCGVCTALAKQRQTARDRGDLSAATNADIEIRYHPHRTRR